MINTKEKVSIVIPCYNEADSLNRLFLKITDIEKVIKSKYDLEIIFVNDGSIDNTYEILSKRYNGRKDVIIITYKNNKGYGYALKKGLKRVSGDLVVTIDADTNYDQREVPSILSKMESGCDIVIASPFSQDGKWRYPGLRFILSRVLSKIYDLILQGKGDGISTYTSCFRVYRKNILSHILPGSDDFVANAEILIRAILEGYRIEEYPTQVYKREFGKSKMKIVRTIIAHIKFIWKIYRREFNVRYLRDL